LSDVRDDVVDVLGGEIGESLGASAEGSHGGAFSASDDGGLEHSVGCGGEETFVV